MLFSQTRQEHTGVFVVRSRSCVLAGSRRHTRNAVNDSNQHGNAVQHGGGGPGRATVSYYDYFYFILIVNPSHFYIHIDMVQSGHQDDSLIQQ